MVRKLLLRSPARTSIPFDIMHEWVITFAMHAITYHIKPMLVTLVTQPPRSHFSSSITFIYNLYIVRRAYSRGSTTCGLTPHPNMEQAPVKNQKDVSEWALAAALRDNRRHSNEDHPGAVPPVHNSGETPELNSNSFE